MGQHLLEDSCLHGAVGRITGDKNEKKCTESQAALVGPDHSVHSLAWQARVALEIGLQGAVWSEASPHLSGHPLLPRKLATPFRSPCPPPALPSRQPVLQLLLELGRRGSLPVPGCPLVMMSGSQMIGKPPYDSDTCHQLSVLRAPALWDVVLGLSPGDPDDHPRLKKAFLRWAVTVV